MLLRLFVAAGKVLFASSASDEMCLSDESDQRWFLSCEELFLSVLRFCNCIWAATFFSSGIAKPLLWVGRDIISFTQELMGISNQPRTCLAIFESRLRSIHVAPN